MFQRTIQESSVATPQHQVMPCTTHAFRHIYTTARHAVGLGDTTHPKPQPCSKHNIKALMATYTWPQRGDERA